MTRDIDLTAFFDNNVCIESQPIIRSERKQEQSPREMEIAALRKTRNLIEMIKLSNHPQAQKIIAALAATVVITVSPIVGSARTGITQLDTPLVEVAGQVIEVLGESSRQRIEREQYVENLKISTAMNAYLSDGEPYYTGSNDDAMKLNLSTEGAIESMYNNEFNRLNAAQELDESKGRSM